MIADKQETDVSSRPVNSMSLRKWPQLPVWDLLIFRRSGDPCQGAHSEKAGTADGSGDAVDGFIHWNVTLNSHSLTVCACKGKRSHFTRAAPSSLSTCGTRKYCLTRHIFDMTSSVFVSSTWHIDPRPQWAQPRGGAVSILGSLACVSGQLSEHSVTAALETKVREACKTCRLENGSVCVRLKQGGLAPSKLGGSVLWTGQTGSMKAPNSDKTAVLQPVFKCLIQYLRIYFYICKRGL